jgi:hypothetical protein
MVGLDIFIISVIYGMWRFGWGVRYGQGVRIFIFRGYSSGLGSAFEFSDTGTPLMPAHVYLVFFNTTSDLILCLAMDNGF